MPGIFAIGDVAAFPLKVQQLKFDLHKFLVFLFISHDKFLIFHLQIYDRVARVEHVDHARRSAKHCVGALLSIHTNPSVSDLSQWH